MASSQLFFFYLFSFTFFSLHVTTASLTTCLIYCHNTGPLIQFPFSLTGEPGNRCGWPGFNLSCNNKTQTIINLPNAGEFIVQNIDYMTQTIWIKDPDSCLSRRFIDSFSLSGSPFDQGDLRSFMFLNCSSDKIPDLAWARTVNCMSGGNFTVVAIPTYSYDESVAKEASCVVVSTVSIPVLWPRWSGLENGIMLRWSVPDCSACAEQGGVCRFKNDDGVDMDVKCFNLPNSNGLPRGAKYGIIIGIVIPGLLCFVGLGCLLCGKLRTYCQRQNHHRSTADFPATFTLQPIAFAAGFDRPTIESFPKTQLGESGRLPKELANDTTCPICLCEYEPKETLRTIPECNHYFHANCIDEWLKLNATCPLCRNSPDGSALVTPSTTSSSTSSSRSSSVLSP